MWFYMKYIALNRGWRILMSINCRYGKDKYKTEMLLNVTTMLGINVSFSLHFLPTYDIK
jgi:hypothetical protein